MQHGSRVATIKKVTPEQRLERGEGVSHTDMWVKGRGKQQSQGG